MESEIQYHPSAEQLALANTIEDSLAELLPLSRVHRAHEEDEDAWRQLEEIGIFAMGLAEAAGGSGLGAESHPPARRAAVAGGFFLQRELPADEADTGERHPSGGAGRAQDRRSSHRTDRSARPTLLLDRAATR